MNNEHAILVEPSQSHYKNGDIIRVVKKISSVLKDSK